MVRRNSARTASKLRADLETVTGQLETAKGELLASQGSFDAAADTARVGLWELDYATGKLRVSEQFAAQTGTTSTDWNSWSDLVDRLHPEDRKDHLLTPVVSPVGEMVESFFRLRHVDGSYKRIRARSGTIGTDEFPVGRVGAHIDTTDDQFVHLKEELLDTNERLQEFTRLASHDLRSPVRAIISLVGFVKEDSGPELNDLTRAHLAKIEARAGRMNDLLDGLLEYALAGERQSTVESIDPSRLIFDAVEGLDSHGCQIVIEHSGPRIWTWAAPLATCIRKLVDNAFKHHGGSTGLVTVKAAVVDNWLELSVSDDGPGIPAMYRAQVFEPFRSLKSSDEVEGSGIGLAVVRKIIKVHGGSLQLESEVGFGTELRIRWPVANKTTALEGSEDVKLKQYGAPAHR